MLDVTAVLKEVSESFQRADLFITDVGRKLDTAIANLELLKNDKPPTELSKFQTSSRAATMRRKRSYWMEKTIAKKFHWKIIAKVQISVSFFQDFGLISSTILKSGLPASAAHLSLISLFLITEISLFKEEKELLMVTRRPIDLLIILPHFFTKKKKMERLKSGRNWRASWLHREHWNQVMCMHPCLQVTKMT